MRLVWLMMGPLLAMGLPATGLGVADLAGGNPIAAVIALGIGLPLLLPAAHYLRAEVTVREGLLTKRGVFRKITCPVESVASIRPYATPYFYDLKSMSTVYLRGYEFKLADGTSVLKLYSGWWSDTVVAQIAQRLGIRIAGGDAGAVQRRLVVQGTPLDLGVEAPHAGLASQSMAAQSLHVGPVRTASEAWRIVPTEPDPHYHDLWDEYTELVASPATTDFRKSLRAAADTDRWSAILCLFQLMALTELWPRIMERWRAAPWGRPGVGFSPELSEINKVISKTQLTEAGVARAIDEIRQFALTPDAEDAPDDSAEIKALTGALATNMKLALQGSADPHDGLVALELEVKARVIKEERGNYRKYLHLSP